MKNYSKTKGDNHIIIQDIKESNVFYNKNDTSLSSPKKSKLGLIGVLVAIIGVLVAVIIGWENILNFFAK